MSEMDARMLKQELLQLKWNLLFLVACIAIAATFGLMARHTQQQAERNYRQAQQSFEQMQAKANHLRSEEQEVRQRIAQYHDLVNRGVIGSEQRLDWVDTLRAIQRDRKLLGLEYEIQPQQVMPANAFPTQTPGHDFLASSMQVKIPLLHEDDLINFLADLRDRSPAFIRVRECHIGRVAQSAVPSGIAPAQMPQLESTCLLDWITIREKAK